MSPPNSREIAKLTETASNHHQRSQPAAGNPNGHAQTVILQPVKSLRLLASSAASGHLTPSMSAPSRQPRALRISHHTTTTTTHKTNPPSHKQPAQDTAQTF